MWIDAVRGRVIDNDAANFQSSKGVERPGYVVRKDTRLKTETRIIERRQAGFEVGHLTDRRDRSKGFVATHSRFG